MLIVLVQYVIRKKTRIVASGFHLFVHWLHSFQHIFKHLAVGFHPHFRGDNIPGVIIEVLIDTVVHQPIGNPTVVAELYIISLFLDSAKNVIQRVEL